MTKIIKLIILCFLFFYVLNPGAGIFEAIPDNLPWIGNLDEAAAVAFAIHIIRSFKQPKEGI